MTSQALNPTENSPWKMLWFVPRQLALLGRLALPSNTSQQHCQKFNSFSIIYKSVIFEQFLAFKGFTALTKKSKRLQQWNYIKFTSKITSNSVFSSCKNAKIFWLFKRLFTVQIFLTSSCLLALFIDVVRSSQKINGSSQGLTSLRYFSEPIDTWNL